MYFHTSQVDDDDSGSNMGVAGCSDHLCNISLWSYQNLVALLMHEPSGLWFQLCVFTYVDMCLCP